MELVGGTAGGMSLISPPETEEVRPTSVRARRALFDSLGDLSGRVFADLFAGSGAMGLEAASRGAAHVIFAEAAVPVIRIIRKNCEKVQTSGISAKMEIVEGMLPRILPRLCSCVQPDIIFADPPYAQSADLLAALTADASFTGWAAKAQLFWELPDGSVSVRPPSAAWRIFAVKSLGSARFMVLKPLSKTKK